MFAEDVLKELGEMRFPFSEYHREIANTLVSERYALVMVARSHLKTTILNCYILWRLFREKKHQLCLVSSTVDQSKKNIYWIKSAIEEIEWLKHLKPGEKEDTWSKLEFRTTNNNRCFTKPLSDSARGEHANETVYDDILRESDMSMAEIKRIFWNVFYPMGKSKGGKHLIIGTPINKEDLFAQIEDKVKKGNKRWFILKKPAIIKDENGKDKPLWDKAFSMQDLMDMKDDMGTYDFNRELLLDPTAEGSGFFPSEWVLAACDDDLSFDYVTKGTVFIGADFALSDSPTGDYNVFVVVESRDEPITRKVHKDGKWHTVTIENPIIIRHIERFKGGHGQVRKLKELYEIYNPVSLVIDISNFGKRFEQDLIAEGLRVDGQDFRPASRALLLANLRKVFETEDPLFNPPRLVIPTSQENFTFDSTKHLIHELSGFRETKTPGGFQTIASSLAHDDVVFSVAMAVKNIVEQKRIVEDIFVEIPAKQDFNFSIPLKNNEPPVNNKQILSNKKVSNNKKSFDFG